MFKRVVSSRLEDPLCIDRSFWSLFSFFSMIPSFTTVHPGQRWHGLTSLGRHGMMCGGGAGTREHDPKIQVERHNHLDDWFGSLYEATSKIGRFFFHPWPSSKRCVSKTALALQWTQPGIGETDLGMSFVGCTIMFIERAYSFRQNSDDHRLLIDWGRGFCLKHGKLHRVHVHPVDPCKLNPSK